MIKSKICKSKISTFSVKCKVQCLKVFVTMATNLPSWFLIQFLEQLLKFLANFILLKYVKSQRSYGFLITKVLIFTFQILDLKITSQPP